MTLTLAVEHQALSDYFLCHPGQLSEGRTPASPFLVLPPHLVMGGRGRGTQGQMTLLAFARDSLCDLEQ